MVGSEFVGRAGAAGILDVSESTVRKWQREGRLTPFMQIGNRLFFRRADVEALRTALAAGQTQRSVHPQSSAAA